MKNLQVKKQYDLVTDDGYDSRIPLHNEEAFQHGVTFQAKYIGTLDVPRPSSRVEIVAAMRRIRYEFKAKGIKKKKVNITVSTDGVKISMTRKKKKKPWPWEENRLLVMQHPIYRIFYVSHDSQDLKIFSYIARDGSTNVFKCNVFKAYKKSLAMRIVRTIGQAFEVCHKISVSSNGQEEEGTGQTSEKKTEAVDPAKESPILPQKSLPATSTPIDDRPSGAPQGAEDVLNQAQALLHTAQSKAGETAGTISSPVSPPLREGSVSPFSSMPGQPGLSSHHQVQLLRQRLEQQEQQTQVALAQVTLLKDQLSAETAARIEAQARTHQLLVQNRDLLQHINVLVGRLQFIEGRVSGAVSADNFSRLLPQVPILPDTTTPEPGPLFMSPDFEAFGALSISPVANRGLYENTNTKGEYTESPDSGHREMSSDSLVSTAGQETYSWYTSATPSIATIHSNAHSNVYRSASSNGHVQGTMSGGNRPELNLPLRSSSNPFTGIRPISVPVSSSITMGKGDGNYQNVSTPNKKDMDIIMPLPSQDASGNKLDLVIAPKIDPPPKVNRRLSRGSYVGVTSPDANGNHSSMTSSQSSNTTMSENSFEYQLNQLLEQATGQGTVSENNTFNEEKEMNNLGKTDVTSAKNSVNNLSHNSAKRKRDALIISMSEDKQSFSDEENTEEISDEPEMKLVSTGTELAMFTEFDNFAS